MFCKNCGKELANDAKFCDACGATMAAPAVETPVQQAPVQQVPVQQVPVQQVPVQQVPVSATMRTPGAGICDIRGDALRDASGAAPGSRDL